MNQGKTLGKKRVYLVRAREKVEGQGTEKNADEKDKSKLLKGESFLSSMSQSFYSTQKIIKQGQS